MKVYEERVESTKDSLETLKNEKLLARWSGKFQFEVKSRVIGLTRWVTCHFNEVSSRERITKKPTKSRG